MEKVTYKSLIKTFPEEKKSVESLYGRIIPVRKISYLVSIPLINMNVSAFAASVISLITAVLACVFISLPHPACRIIGIILVPVWHVFDCVDGNIARYKKTASEFGSAVDAICGYFILSFLPLALGIASYNIGDNFFGISPSIFIICGALASICSTLMRLIHQKYAYEAMVVEGKTGKYIEKGDHQYTLTGFHKLRKMVEVECGPVGIAMFVLWVCPIFNLYHILAVYYCIFYTMSMVVITAFYLKKCL